MLHFVPTIHAPDSLDAPALWFIFAGHRLLVLSEGGDVRVPTAVSPDDLPLDQDNLLRQLYLGYIDGERPFHCYAAEVPKTAVSTDQTGLEWVGLRGLYLRLSDDMLQLAGRALQYVDWDRSHQFCSRCGAPASLGETERVKKCGACGLSMYPRLAPAIIVAITREGQNGRDILLARNHRYPPGMYSVLAGFVEPGESLEECVTREVFEEVGIRVRDIRYFGSQPWPFPHSLMVGFTAVYDSGDFVLEDEEIAEARWFPADRLPLVPPGMSIARQLIDAFVAAETTP